MNYIEGKVYGLPKPKRKGYNTRYKHTRKEYIHKVTINGSTYFKVHLARNSGTQSKIKYFKTEKEAELFVEMLRLNKYL